MLHPSYTDLMKVVNKDVEEGETKIVNSRYSIVMATAKRAREIIVAIDELNQAKIKVAAEEEPKEIKAQEAEDIQEDKEQRVPEEVLE